MTNEITYHTPAVLKESIDCLNVRKGGTYADLTLGGGGHTREILRRLEGEGRLFGFDHDADAEQNIPNNPCFTFIRSNFRYFANFMDWHAVEKVDGIIADLGVSFHHFDDKSRGFSFRFDSPLDMRMNRRAGKTAAFVLNTYSEADLADLLYLYGELRSSRAIAQAIVRKRNERKIATTGDFMEILKPFCSRENEKKQLAQAFQALRIEVNAEMDALKELLLQSEDYLKTGGRLVVITYHSLEDRLVKNFIRSGNFTGEVEKDFYGNYNAPFKAVNNKVITPSEEEIAANPRSRSAKMRAGERVDSRGN